MRRPAAAPFVRVVLVVLAAIAVTATAAPMVWHAMGHHAMIPDPAPIPARAEVEAEPVDISGSMALAPFGRVPEAAPAQVAEQADLNLVLLGVIVRDDPSRSMALISLDGAEANYRPGEAIREDVTLTSVAQAKITVDVNGTSRDVYFAGSQIPADADKVLTGAERLAALVNSGGGETISERYDAAQRKSPQTTQDYIDLWRDRIRANPGQVLSTIGLVPTEKGYMVAEEHDTGVNRAGLQSGDIVTSVNGQSVGDVEKDRALYDAVAASGLARIEVERNGRTIVMSFPLE